MQFDVLYRDYWDRIFRLCMGYVNDNEIARDMTQDIFVIVLQQLPKFRNEANHGTWIYRIATNFCLRSTARLKKQALVKLADHPAAEEQGDIEMQVQLLYKFVSELPELDRLLISLELDNIKQQEIAQITGLTEVNVRVRIHRIKQFLARKFKNYER